MLDLDAIEARAEVATLAFRRFEKPLRGSHLPPLANLIRNAAIELAAAADTIPALVAELRAAREVVEAAHKWKSALTWDAEWSIRPAEVGSTLQRKSELLEALAAPAGAHVHYDDFYDPAGELDDDFDAYRAVVGPA
jgi:hypothetical protein